MSYINARFTVTASLIAGLLTLAAADQGLTYSDLHDFEGIVRNASDSSVRDGGAPSEAVTFDASGNMYGTTNSGGLYQCGNVWKLTRAGKYTDLHDFGGKVKRSNGTTGQDGAHGGSIVIDKAGNLYGYAFSGGYYGVNGTSSAANGYGILWKLTPKGVYTDIHDFGDVAETSTGLYVADGAGPTALAIDANGNLFGTTMFGGLHEGGIAFELASNGAYTDIHDFGGITSYIGTKPIYDGMQPSGIALDKSGNVFGVTQVGGLYGGPGGPQGIIWEITQSGAYSNLHNFGGTVTDANGSKVPDGSSNGGVLSFDKGGNLYGTTPSGGSANQGAVWKLTSSAIYTHIYEFTNISDGTSPEAGVLVDGKGNIFGTTTIGGLNGDGSVFELSSTGTLRDLHDFGGYTKVSGVKLQNPYHPLSNLTFDSNGHIYGTTSQGGKNASSTASGGNLFVLK